MTEEQLAAVGWTPPPMSDGLQKTIGRATARISINGAGEWRGWSYCYLGIATSIRAGCETATGTLAFCAHYAEHQARAIEAWLAGDEAAALEHARRAGAPLSDPTPEEP